MAIKKLSKADVWSLPKIRDHLIRLQDEARTHVSGSGGVNEIPYFLDPHRLDSEANLTYNPDTNLLAVQGIASIGNISGGNYTDVEADGTVHFNGDATVWEDLRVPAQNTKLNPANSEPAFESLIGGLYAYKFDTSNADNESVHFIAQMSHKYKEGSDIYPHIHWCPDSTNTGDVYWSFEYTIANVNGTIGATTTDEITVPADGTSLKHQLDEFTTIDGTGLTISHIIICRLTRRSTTQAADTFTGNACFLEFDFHFECDTVGSRTVLIK